MPPNLSSAWIGLAAACTPEAHSLGEPLTVEPLALLRSGQAVPTQVDGARPVVGVAEDGSLLTAWRSQHADRQGLGAFYRWHHADGTTHGPVVPLGSTGANRPCVAISRATAVIGWEDEGAIAVQAFDVATGLPLTDPNPVAPAEIVQARCSIDVLEAAQGRPDVVVTWEEGGEAQREVRFAHLQLTR